MRRFIGQYRKRILFAAAAIVFFPALLFLLLWWDSRPKPDAQVSISYLKTVTQGRSNVVTFVITNHSDFPISYVVFFLTPDGSRSEDWGPTFPSGLPGTWPVGSTPAMSNSLISVGAFSTGRWKIQIGGGDSRVSTLDNARRWVDSLLRQHSDWWSLADRVTGWKARVRAYGPEMFGDAPAQSTK